MPQYLKFIPILILSLFLGPSLKAYDTIPYLGQQDTLLVEHIEGYGNFVRHLMMPKQTLYSLAKFYGISIFALYEFNPQLNQKVVSIGEEIIIPVFNLNIFTEKRFGQYEGYIPLCYRVKPKDNLFRISRYYFDVNKEQLKNLNQLENNNLSTGQILQIGWIKINQVNSLPDDGYEITRWKSNSNLLMKSLLLTLWKRMYTSKKERQFGIKISTVVAI